MAIFKYSIKPQVLADDETGIPAGPFLVHASDRAIGWQLLRANFALGLSKALRGAPANRGRNGRCVEIDPALDPHTLQQRKEILGVDTAQWYLSRPEIRSDDGRYARMLWWPLSPEDRCPV
jgi:hypothetical protein